MGHWEFKLEHRDALGMKSPEEFLNSIFANYDYRGNEREEKSKLSVCLSNFFGDEHIKKLVEENAWEDIFKCWQEDYNRRFEGRKYYGNYPGWITEELASFLALSGIDFWNYFPDKDKIDYRVKNLTGLYWIE